MARGLTGYGGWPAQADLEAPLPQSVCAVYPPGSMEVRRETGKRGAAALIWHEGKLVGVLEPAHIAKISAFWAEHGVELEGGAVTLKGA